MTIAFLITAFLLGIGGSMHCLGMCGPLVMAVPFQGGTQKRSATLIYYLAKCLAYGSMGSFMGLLGKGISLFNWQQGLSIIAGIIILVMAFVPALLKRIKGNYLFQNEFNAIFSRLYKEPRTRYYFALGFLNGFLPCGLTLTALAASSVTTNPLTGFLFMFCFGLGTTPALAALTLFKTRVGLRFLPRFKKASFLISVSLGILLILRGMNLGIPYLSPESGVDGAVKNCCIHPLP